MDDITIRRRNRLKDHFTLVSNVLIFGYPDLTDAEKLTYQAIDSFDWPDERGERKGCAYPSIERLASLRSVDRRTIFRHIDALETAKLVTREQRAGRPSLLWIEEPSEEESEQYLSTIAMGRDTNVTPTRDTDVTPYKKEEPEKDKTVNAEQSSRRGKGERRKSLSAEERAKREWLAQEILKVCGDKHSLGFYRGIAQRVPEHRVFKALSEVRLAARENRIRISRGALFASLIRGAK